MKNTKLVTCVLTVSPVSQRHPENWKSVRFIWNKMDTALTQYTRTFAAYHN